MSPHKLEHDGVDTHLQLTLAVAIEVVPFLLLLLWFDTDLLGLMLVPFLLVSVLTVAAVTCRTIRVDAQLGTREGVADSLCCCCW